MIPTALCKGMKLWKEMGICLSGNIKLIFSAMFSLLVSPEQDVIN